MFPAQKKTKHPGRSCDYWAPEIHQCLDITNGHFDPGFDPGRATMRNDWIWWFGTMEFSWVIYG
jgi:hypothetical protein